MQGRYERDGAPRAEHQIARRLEWDSSLLLAQSIGTLLLVVCGSASIFIPAGPPLDLVGAGWRIGAAILLCAAGRTAMISWRRWSRSIPSVSSYLLHRLRRLTPVHLVSFSVVVATVSAFSLMGMPDEASSIGVALNIIPLWPNAFAAQNNPSWFILQALVIGSMAVPVLSMAQGRTSRTLLIIALLGSGSLVPAETIWSVTTFLASAFLMGAMITNRSNPEPMARAGLLIMSTMLLAAGQAMSEFPALGSAGSMVTVIGAGLLVSAMPALRAVNPMRRLTRYAYPAIMLPYPILRFGAVAGGPVSITLSILVAVILTYATGRLLERPHAKETLRRFTIEEAGHRMASDPMTGLPYHPEKGDNPEKPEKRSHRS